MRPRCNIPSGISPDIEASIISEIQALIKEGFDRVDIAALVPLNTISPVDAHNILVKAGLKSIQGKDGEMTQAPLLKVA